MPKRLVIDVRIFEHGFLGDSSRSIPVRQLLIEGLLRTEGGPERSKSVHTPVTNHISASAVDMLNNKPVYALIANGG